VANIELVQVTYGRALIWTTMDTKHTAKWRDYLFSWSGNKSREVGTILEVMDKNGIKLEDVDTVAEVFGGSFAFIRFLVRNGVTKRYRVSDMDSNLIGAYQAMADEKTNGETIEALRAATVDLDQAKYKGLVKQPGLVGYLVKYGLCGMRAGAWPGPGKSINYERMAGFTKFAQVEFTACDAFARLEELKDDPRALVFLDPPYFLSSNDFYMAGLTDAFFKLIDNRKAYKCRMVFVINDHLLTRAFMQVRGIPVVEADVTYSRSKTKTKHLYFTNGPWPEAGPVADAVAANDGSGVSIGADATPTR
jgi:site-specific DNA-adenine methylase